MASDSARTASQTICVDAESSLDGSELCPNRSREAPGSLEPSVYDSSIAIDASSQPVSAVGSHTPAVADYHDAVDTGPCTPQLSETALCHELAQQLEAASHARRNEEEETLTRRFLEEENEYLFRRYLAMEERRMHRKPRIPRCAKGNPWLKALWRRVTNISSGTTVDMWLNHDVRHCDCLGGPQGFHRPDCRFRNAGDNVC